MMLIPSDPRKISMLREIRDLFPGNESNAQRNRVLEVLARGYPLNTFESSRHLDVYYAPARVRELRKAGLKIVTHWTTVQTESGHKHRVGNYLMVREVCDAE